MLSMYCEEVKSNEYKSQEDRSTLLHRYVVVPMARISVMVRLCHSNDFGSLQVFCQFGIRVLSLLFAFQLVTR
jgi:hypothetical protein